MPDMPRHGVYAITDPTLLPDELLLSRVRAALSGGVRLLQYRNKQATTAQQLAQLSALKPLCHEFGAALLVNDSISLCAAAGADGVHLGQQDGQIEAARRTLGDRAIIGVTCHNALQLAQQAQQAGANYVALGRFFASYTKPQAPAASLDDLRRIRERISLPIVAIGGVNVDNGASLIAAGADMLAVIHYLFAKPDTQQRAKALTDLFRGSHDRFQLQD